MILKVWGNIVFARCWENYIREERGSFINMENYSKGPRGPFSLAFPHIPLTLIHPKHIIYMKVKSKWYQISINIKLKNFKLY